MAVLDVVDFELELEDLLDNTPQYDTQGLTVRIEDGCAVFKMYRGTDTDNLEGVSWWTTDMDTASLYASSRIGGYIMVREVRIPVVANKLHSSCPYLLGGRYTPPTVGDGYSYGISGDISLKQLRHFDMSVDEYALYMMSKDMGNTPVRPLQPSGITITL